MKIQQIPQFRFLLFLIGLLPLAAAPARAIGEPTAEAISAFNAYVKAVESRLARQHQIPK